MIIILLVFILFISVGCFEIDKEDPKIIVSSDVYSIDVGSEVTLPIQIDDLDVTYYPNTEGILEINANKVKGIRSGVVVLSAKNSQKTLKQYVIRVNSHISEIQINGENFLPLDASTTYTATFNTENVLVNWTSSDDAILSIDENGLACGVSEGLVTLTATPVENPEMRKSIVVIVAKDTPDDAKDTFVNTEEVLTNSLLSSVLYPIIDDIKSYTIYLNAYTSDRFGNDLFAGTFCGIIYKRQYILNDGTVKDTVSDNDIVVKYRYFALTNRHVVKGTKKITALDPSINLELKAKTIQYDKKVDMAIISFDSNVYYKEAIFGDSDEAKSGEFIITVGAPMGSTYYSTASIGIISHTSRYLSDDTDGDDVNDWDSEYIQHDASVNQGCDGSPLVNLKGEVIGMNTLKISSVKTEDMAFAIPINIMKELITPLEKGIQIERPILGVSAIEVKTIIVSEYYKSKYPIDEEIKFGIYIVEVNEGVAKKAGVQVNDILIQINGVNIYYTYILRAELGKFVIGSGEECEITVYRGGEYITLTVTF